MQGKTVYRSFTLLELLVVISIIAIVAGIILPALNRARNKAKEAKCLNDLKLVGMGLAMYTNDNQEKIPPQDISSEYAQSSSNIIQDADGHKRGLAILINKSYNVRPRMLGCDLHDPRLPKRVVKDWKSGGETKSAYIYREADGLNEIMSHPANSGKAIVMDFSLIDSSGKVIEMAHSFIRTNILYCDGHVHNAYNNNKEGVRFTAAQDGLFISDGTEESIDKIWKNADSVN